jgi:DNA repair protein RecN (Recombination protein N)
MARLSLTKQILAVSHLPQICAMADYNIKVEKYSDNITTHTKATILEDVALYTEIARLMGTIENEQGLIVSKELKNKSEQYKQKLK